jgi:DNA-binding transcriptional ArsR family regulator
MLMKTCPSIDTQYLERAADVLKTVAHPMRLQIIDALEKGEKSVTELCQHIGAQQPYMSQQLNLMKSKGILASRRNGNQVFYTIANFSVVKVIQCVRQQASGQENGAKRYTSECEMRDLAQSETQKEFLDDVEFPDRLGERNKI